jgi:hypothetical protein
MLIFFLNIIVYPCGVRAQDDPGLATISDSLCVLICFLIIIDAPTSVLWKLGYQQRHLVQKQKKLGEEMADEFLPKKYLFHSRGVFQHAVKSYDMGLTASIPHRRKSCCGILPPLEIHRPPPGLNLRFLDPMASALPVDHRGRLFLLLMSTFRTRPDIFYKASTMVVVHYPPE